VRGGISILGAGAFGTALAISLARRDREIFLWARDAALLDGRRLVACCKGIDLATGRGPAEIIASHCPRSPVAVLTGPSFAADIARGLPTALALACQSPVAGSWAWGSEKAPALH